ncbi:DUF1570 domain-containing protein [Mangrovimicrobium sediminis]|uniref:DUF1570 domain-containing protein n=1 Tax=Mangrovimicrobium sediminis TaxID=2562682 RepID=A0A4Z0LXA6_9GAMM|nr:DUF1570 domain-containing protein [Haliea sp. SAOS-164]TGD71796.1 DUF1570 domain-containing protein [Haliea sp. SAOS-164]
MNTPGNRQFPQRPFRPAWSLAAAACVALLLFGPLPAQARDWTAYTSEHFTVYSDRRASRVEPMLREFEAFRTLVLMLVGATDRSEHARVTIIMFDSRGEYRDVAPPNSAGFYAETLNGPYMVTGPGTRGIQQSHILHHEYVHYLVRELLPEVMHPQWYREGLAEYLSASEFSRGEIILGAIPEVRARTLQYEEFGALPVAEVLAPDPERMASPRHRSRFYAYAWLLTHYLQTTSLTEGPLLMRQLNAYLSRYAQGEESITAFEASFGMSTDEMDATLARYRKQRRFNVVRIPQPAYTGEIQARKLSLNESLVLRAELAIEAEKIDAAADYLDDIDVDSPGVGRALSLIATLNAPGSDVPRAAAERARELDPDDPAVLANLATFAWHRAVASEDDTAARESALQDCLCDGERAIALAAERLGAYQSVWQCQLAMGDRAAAGRTLMAAYRRYPGSLDINLQLGTLMLEYNPPLARPFLERVHAWSHSAEQRATIAEILEVLDEAQSGAALKPGTASPPASSPPP